MVGAKTVTSSLLVVLASLLGWWIGLSPMRLATLSATEAFWAGLFALFSGSMAYRYWGFGHPSRHYFRWNTDEQEWEGESHFLGSVQRRILVGENAGDAFDFGPSVQYVLSIALAFWIGFITIDSRAVQLMATLPARAAESGAEYCPEPKVAMVQTTVALEPGCALIKRAFELGYAKNLGPCEPKAEQRISQAKCTLRQRDEPLLHYAWRRLAESQTALGKTVSLEQLHAMKSQFQTRLHHLEPLYAASSFTVAGAPRASHHLFTNLPKPPGLLLPELRPCEERYRRLPHGAHQGPSDRLDRALGQLLFDPRYSASAGACREFTVHWGAPADACARLVQDPSAFLKEQGALREVNAMLMRYRVTAELQEMEGAQPSTAGGMSALAKILRSVPPGRFVSFACWIEEERPAPQRSLHEVNFDGETFVISEARVPTTLAGTGTGAAYYRQVAAMLVPSFHYGNLLSSASAGSVLESGVDARFFTGDFGFLARLDYLTDVDVFLENRWIENRRDLLDVYPYHLHLKNYVALFRGRYRSERGRL